MSAHFSWQSGVIKAELPATVKLTLLVIGTYMNMHGNGAFPSYNEIASSSSLSRRKVIDAVSFAVTAGWLKKASRDRANGSCSSNEYEVSFPSVGSECNAPHGAPDALGSAQDALGVVHHVHQGSAPRAPRITPQLNTPVLTPKPKQAANATLRPDDVPCTDQPHTAKTDTAKNTKKQKSPAKTAQVWNAYSTAFFNRYGTEPTSNARVSAQLSQFIDRIGADDAPHVAAFYLQSSNRYYVQKCHAVGPMLADAEALRTQWATGNTMTEGKARSTDRLGDISSIINGHFDPNAPF